MRRWIWIILAVCFFLGLGWFLFWNRHQRTEDIAPLRVTFLKVGKADAAILECGGGFLVLDTGEEDDGPELIVALQKAGCTRVDALILTHFDQDHIGGADQLLEAIPVGTVYLPDYEGEGSDWNELVAALARSDCRILRLQEPAVLRLGDASVEIDPPGDYAVPAGASDYDNEFSLIVTVRHGQKRLVFTGDAEKARLREYLAAKPASCDFLKLPHHGIYNTELGPLLQALRPQYGVICSSRKHPAEDRVLETAARMGVKVLETRNGDIVLESDGHSLALRQKGS